MPDLSCSIYLCFRGDKDSIDIKGEHTSKDVTMDFLYENDKFAYYKITYLIGTEDETKTISVLSKTEQIELFDRKSYAECVPESFVYSEYRMMKEMIPLAEHEVFDNNNMDCLINYGEELLNTNGEKLIDIIETFIENPNSMQCLYNSKEMLLQKCQELLNKYGG